MKHRILATCFLGIGLCGATSALSDPTTAATVVDDSGNYGDSYGYGRGRNLTWPGVLADLILLRPVGLVMTVGGVGLVAATAPLTGIASLAPPHDAFLRVGNALVVGPAGFTFNRPLGEFSYQRSGVYPVLTKPADRPMQGPVPVLPRESIRTRGSGNAASSATYHFAPGRLQYPTGQ